MQGECQTTHADKPKELQSGISLKLFELSILARHLFPNPSSRKGKNRITIAQTIRMRGEIDCACMRTRPHGWYGTSGIRNGQIREPEHRTGRTPETPDEQTKAECLQIALFAPGKSPDSPGELYIRGSSPAGDACKKRAPLPEGRAKFLPHA